MIIAAQWKVHSDADLLHEVLRITHRCIHICAFFSPFSFSPTTARNGYKRMGGYGVSRVLTNVQAKSFLVIYQDAVCLARIRRPVLGQWQHCLVLFPALCCSITWLCSAYRRLLHELASLERGYPVVPPRCAVSRWEHPLKANRNQTPTLELEMSHTTSCQDRP